jgi:pyruvate kinase
VIIATQMLESMITNLRPTRAEVSDVANAIYDCTDAIMLSGETAAGKHPIKAVEIMVRVAKRYEKVRKVRNINMIINDGPDAIVLAAFKMLKSEFISKLNIKAFVVLTETGNTAKLLARLRPDVRVIAVTDRRITRNQLALVYGVTPFYMKFPHGKLNATGQVLRKLKEKKILLKGDNVILTHGDTWRQPGRSNTIKILEITE